MKHLLTLTLLCFGLLAQAQIPSYVPTNGLVGWWPFNGNANDESGNGNHGTVNGATLAADRFGNAGKAYSFDGVDDFIQISSFGQFIPDSITIQGWMKNLNSSNGIQFIVNGNQNTSSLSLYFNNLGFGNIINQNCNNSFQNNFGRPPITNEWVNFTFSKTPNVVSFFINGSLISSQSSLAFSTQCGNNFFYLGNDIVGNQEFFSGLLDDITIYNRALSASEVQQLYSGQSACNLSVSLSATDTLAACGTPPTLNAGNAGATYAWNTGDSSQTITANTSGWYSVTVSQNGCSAKDSVYVNLLQVDLGNDTTVCRNSAVVLTPNSNQFRLKSNPNFQEFLKYNGNSYLVYNQMMTWEDAKKLGDSLGLQMYVINDQAEENAVYAALPEKGNDGINYWLGLYQEINGPFYSEPAGGWRWVDGRYLHQGYSNWYSPVQPDNSLGEKYAQLEWAYYGPKWNDGGDNGNCPCNYSKPIYETTNLFSSTLWSTGDTTPSITVTPSQTTTYYCTVSDGISTCTDSVTVFVTSPPVLSLPDTLRSSTRPVVLQPGSAAQYAWSTGDTTSSLSVNTAGTYSVTAANAAGCSASDTCLVLFSNLAPAVATPASGRFNYQASVMDLLGKPLANRTLAVRFSISDSSSTNYVETQSITTDARGHFATQVGAGTVAAGSLDNISWWDGLSRALRIEIDTTGRGSWMQLGSSSLVAVPFSMYALRSGDGSRSVYGSFDANGNVVSGRGFSVTPLGNGRFEIEFQQPFSEMPNIYIKSTGNGNYSEKIISKFFNKTILEVLGNPDQIQFEAKGK